MKRSIALLIGAVWASSAASPNTPSPETLFSSYAPLNVTLEAPFDTLRERLRQEITQPVVGALTYTDPTAGEVHVSDVDVSGRGNTNFDEGQCDFPKLKLRFDAAKGRPPGSLFDGMSTLKIGTHCGDGSDDVLSERWGRLQNEKSPLREAFVYRLLEALQVPSLKARPVRISYVDAKTATTLVRYAMFLEDEHEAQSRLGAAGRYTEKTFGSADVRFTPAESARLAFAEALVGNYDWCVRFFPEDTYRCDGRHGLWNVLAFKRPDGSALPMPYDFDLAGMVTGHHRWFPQVFNPAFAPGAPEATLEVLGQLQRARTLFTRAQLDDARADFVSHKAAAYVALAEAQVDDAGRRLAKAHLDAFFDVIESDERFYLPVVVADNTRIYLDAQQRKPACHNPVVPRGTPVGAAMESRGAMRRVLILDALWQWGPPSECDAVHSKGVWVEASAISPHYPG